MERVKGKMPARHVIALLLLAAFAAGCGSSSTTTKTTTQNAPESPTKPASITELKQIQSGEASGDYAVAQVTGTVKDPSKIELRITAKPAQSGTVSWNMVCTQKNLGAGTKSGQVEKQLPATMTLQLPAAADKLKDCIVSGNVQIKQSGTATIAIYG